ncbi:hypothetical protein ACIRQF_08550 [Streptomyces sp. NPDC101191]|uniref:hypothetical protein n=1 Tax=Streptomyces sp. NPDC101191 TaxID=3366126 RepID=UPI0037FB7ED9
MGTDISGYIECERDYRVDFAAAGSFWHPAMDLDHLYDTRDPRAFGCLFGVGDRSFEPLASERGLPSDVSQRVAWLVEELGGRWPSWISWAEVERVDWDETAPAVDPHIHEYRRRTPEGDWCFHASGGYNSRFEQVSGLNGHEALYPGNHWPEGTEWADGDRLFRVERLTRRQAVPEVQWSPVWTVMRTLAARHGAEHVRLVVWFS